MLGYYKEPELTQRGAHRGRLAARPATRARSTAEGNLKITGRVKDLFKTSKGKYVAPAPIEDRLRHARRHRGLLRHRRQPRPAAGAGDAQRRGGAARGRCAPAAAELEASLAAHVKAINADARPARAAGLPGRHRQAWTVDNDLITPTFKVKRNRIEDLYAKPLRRLGRARARR
jgi:long-chain acyl-CoA synthetase